MRIRFDKIDESIVSLDRKIRHLALLDYELFDKICDKIKYVMNKNVALQIVLIIILERSKLIHIVLCLLKNIEFS